MGRPCYVQEAGIMLLVRDVIFTAQVRRALVHMYKWCMQHVCTTMRAGVGAKQSNEKMTRKKNI